VEQSNCKYRTTISIGITTIYQEHDPEKIMFIADRALYKTKKEKTRVCSWCNELSIFD